MTTSAIIFLTLMIISLIFCVFLLYRNNNTYEMLSGVCYAMKNYLHSNELDEKEYDQFTKELKRIEKITNSNYEKVLFSFFVPVKLEYWYDSDDVELIKKYWR